MNVTLVPPEELMLHNVSAQKVSMITVLQPVYHVPLNVKLVKPPPVTVLNVPLKEFKMLHLVHVHPVCSNPTVPVTTVLSDVPNVPSLKKIVNLVLPTESTPQPVPVHPDSMTTWPMPNVHNVPTNV
jgi:hypothetical protein